MMPTIPISGFIVLRKVLRMMQDFWRLMRKERMALKSPLNDYMDLAASHGLELASILHVNDIGLDFKVVLAEDTRHKQWILRIPRHARAGAIIGREKRILDFLRPRLPFPIPHWEFAEPDFVAYPCLPGQTALQYEPSQGTVTWNVSPGDHVFMDDFAKALAALHSIPLEELAKGGIAVYSPDEVRRNLLNQIERVTSGFEVPGAVETRWRTWIENGDSWPDFSTPIHGDLYLGHVMASPDGAFGGIIDWTEMEGGDPAVDFMAQQMVLDEAGFQRFISTYALAGGRIWPELKAHATSWNMLAPMRYALFALETADSTHLQAARKQLLALQA